MPSLIFSILNATLEPDEDAAGYYPVEESKYDILRKSFIGLSGQSTLNWYITTREDINGKTDGEIIASLFIDIMTSENYEQVKWYREVMVHNDSYAHKIQGMLESYEKKKLRLDNELAVVAAEEILLSAIEKITDDFKEYSAKSDLLEDVLLNLASNATDFQKALDELIRSTEKGNEQIMYEFVDRCISVKNYMNSIYYLCRSHVQFIEKKVRQSNIIERIYETLNDAVKKSLSDQGDKPYFASRDIHALIIKLGLLNSRNKPEIFAENYKSMLSVWGKQRIHAALEDYLNVYREIFADLSMCAVFQFNQLGYLRYLTDQFSGVREMGELLPANMALERVQIVLRTIEHEYPKEKFVNIYYQDADLGIRWTKEWDDIIQTYINGDRQDKYDKRYYDVYTKKIVTSEWVQGLRKDETIEAIGNYYNSLETLTIANKQEVSEKFFTKYLKLSSVRGMRYGTNNCTPIEIMLEAGRNENT